MSFNPVYTLIQTLTGIATGKIRFKKERNGETVQMLNGHRFTVFRHAVWRSKIEKGNEPAVFCVRFHVLGMSPEMNMKFSLILMLFILGLPGFREKYWMINRRNGDFQGLYEWASEEDAKNYVDSFAMKFMTKRSVQGSLSYEIISGIGLEDHLRHLGFR
jgi:hypothetical protein